jgi:hypothetical protein
VQILRIRTEIATAVQNAGHAALVRRLRHRTAGIRQALNDLAVQRTRLETNAFLDAVHPRPAPPQQSSDRPVKPRYREV